MAILFVVEIISFMSHSTETMVVLDQSHDQMVRLRSLVPPPSTSPSFLLSLLLLVAEKLVPSLFARLVARFYFRRQSSWMGW